MKKATPGPWDWDHSNVPIVGDWYMVYVTDADGNVASVADSLIEGDAHLIAAAPDLLAACEAVATHGDDDHPCEHNTETGCWSYIRELARAAVNKATGSPS